MTSSRRKLTFDVVERAVMSTLETMILIIGLRAGGAIPHHWARYLVAAAVVAALLTVIKCWLATHTGDRYSAAFQLRRKD